MKSFWVVVFAGFLVNLQAQTLMQSTGWIDVSQKSDDEIAKIFELEVARFAESDAVEASARVDALNAQEKVARQTFERTTLLLESELNAAVSSREAVEKKLAELRNDSTALASQAEFYARSEQRLRERLEKFPFKAVVLTKAAYSGNLEPVKEKMIYEAGRLAIERINGVQIISETLVKNGMLVRDVIHSATKGKADCQPREWKTIENGTQRVLYLYGVYEIYPLAEGTELSGTVAQSTLLMDTHFINATNDTILVNLPANMQKEIAMMLSTTEQENNDTRSSLALLVQQEAQILRNSGVTTDKASIQNKLEPLKRQIANLHVELSAARQAEVKARRKFEAHRNSEQRIEIVTQSDLERNRSQDEVKAKLMGECVTQFRTVVKSLLSQEMNKVENYMLTASTKQSIMKQVRLRGAKILGIYLSESDGDIKYTASVAFRFEFDYSSNTPSTDLAGTWEGAIKVPGTVLNIAIDFKKSGGAWHGSIDIPVQNAYDLPLANIERNGTSISFDISNVPGNPSFKGTIADDSQSIVGDFKQGGQTFPFALRRKAFTAVEK